MISVELLQTLISGLSCVHQCNNVCFEQNKCIESETNKKKYGSMVWGLIRVQPVKFIEFCTFKRLYCTLQLDANEYKKSREQVWFNSHHHHRSSRLDLSTASVQHVKNRDYSVSEHLGLSRSQMTEGEGGVHHGQGVYHTAGIQTQTTPITGNLESPINLMCRLNY